MSARHAEMHVRPHQTVPEQRPVTVSQGLRQTAEVLLPRARHLVHEVLTVHEACDDVRHDSWRVLACDAWHARIVGRTRFWLPNSCSSSVRPQPPAVANDPDWTRGPPLGAGPSAAPLGIPGDE